MTPNPQRSQNPTQGADPISAASSARAAARRKAWGSNEHTGAQDRVLAAIQQGVSDKRAIETWTGLDRQAVANAINRLVSAGLVRRCFEGGYACARTTCLLAEVWK